MKNANGALYRISSTPSECVTINYRRVAIVICASRISCDAFRSARTCDAVACVTKCCLLHSVSELYLLILVTVLSQECINFRDALHLVGMISWGDWKRETWRCEIIKIVATDIARLNNARPSQKHQFISCGNVDGGQFFSKTTKTFSFLSLFSVPTCLLGQCRI